jgi:hypothetical protein
MVLFIVLEIGDIHKIKKHLENEIMENMLGNLLIVVIHLLKILMESRVLSVGLLPLSLLSFLGSKYSRKLTNSLRMKKNVQNILQKLMNGQSDFTISHKM